MNISSWIRSVVNMTDSKQRHKIGAHCSLRYFSVTLSLFEISDIGIRNCLCLKSAVLVFLKLSY